MVDCRIVRRTLSSEDVDPSQVERGVRCKADGVPCKSCLGESKAGEARSDRIGYALSIQCNVNSDAKSPKGARGLRSDRNDDDGRPVSRNTAH